MRNFGLVASFVLAFAVPQARAAGTQWLTEIRPAPKPSQVRNALTPAGGDVFFTEDDRVEGVGTLWWGDGSTARQVALPSQTIVTSMSTDGRRLIFGLRNGFETTAWRSDGTDVGTFELLPAVAASNPNASVCSAGDDTYLLEEWPPQMFARWALHRTDGTHDGTVLVGEASVMSAPWIGSWRVACLSDRIVMLFHDSVPAWSDATAVAFEFVDGPGYGYVVGDHAVFAPMPAAGDRWQLRRTDGVDPTPVIVAEHVARPGANRLYAMGDRVFYTAADDAGRWAVWTTQGVPDDRVRLVGSQQQPTCAPHGCDDAGFRALGEAAGLFYFVMDGALWRSDGTADGTRQLVASMPAGTFEDFAALADVAYLSVSSPTGAFAGAQLWRSDGTPEGTGCVVRFPEEPSAEIAAVDARLAVLSGPLRTYDPAADPNGWSDPSQCRTVSSGPDPCALDGRGARARKQMTARLARLEAVVGTASPRRVERMIDRLRRRLGRARLERRLTLACAETLRLRLHAVAG